MKLNKLRILVVDDQEMIRTAIKLVMESKNIGGVIDEANSGQSAISSLERNPYDLVLMDISLRGMSGIETTRIILNRWPSTKVLGVSMHTNEDHITEMAEAGAVGYILKDNLVKDIEKALGAITTGENFFRPLEFN